MIQENDDHFQEEQMSCDDISRLMGYYFDFIHTWSAVVIISPGLHGVAYIYLRASHILEKVLDLIKSL